MSKLTMNHPQKLSPRQNEVVGYLANGLSVKEIADVTGLKIGTIKNYIVRIKKKFDAKSTAHCVAIAISRGEVQLNSPLDTPWNQRPNGGNGDEQNE